MSSKLRNMALIALIFVACIFAAQIGFTIFVYFNGTQTLFIINLICTAVTSMSLASIINTYIKIKRIEDENK